MLSQAIDQLQKSAKAVEAATGLPAPADKLSKEIGASVGKSATSIDNARKKTLAWSESSITLASDVNGALDRDDFASASADVKKIRSSFPSIQAVAAAADEDAAQMRTKVASAREAVTAADAQVRSQLGSLSAQRQAAQAKVVAVSNKLKKKALLGLIPIAGPILLMTELTNAKKELNDVHREMSEISAQRARLSSVGAHLKAFERDLGGLVNRVQGLKNGLDALEGDLSNAADQLPEDTSEAQKALAKMFITSVLLDLREVKDDAS